jgi:hypothetical protein
MACDQQALSALAPKCAKKTLEQCWRGESSAFSAETCLNKTKALGNRANQ